MRVVHHHPCAVLLGEVDDLRKLGNVAAHGEHAVRYDKYTALLRHALKLRLKVGHVRVLIAQHFPVGQLASVIYAGVVLAVAYHVIVPPDYGADYAEVRLKAGRERDRALLMYKACQLCFEFEVHFKCAVKKARARAACAVPLKCLYAGLHDLRLSRQPEVIVRAEHYAPLALHDDLNVLTRFQRMEIGIYAFFPVIFCKGKVFAFCENIHRLQLLY